MRAFACGLALRCYPTILFLQTRIRVRMKEKSHFTPLPVGEVRFWIASLGPLAAKPVVERMPLVH